MTDLLAARSQMAMSLAFHMIFATFGMGLPLLVCIAEGLWLKTGEPGWWELARRWAKGTAILFAVGAVSGTVLSFELGLLWPRFMAFAGPIVGMPFSLEGFAFFFEAIFLGIWLYGWEKVRPWVHWLCGVGIAASGAASGAFVVCANAWMNTPAGFTLSPEGTLLSVDPWAAMFNPSAVGQVLHMLVAAYLATGLMTAGIHAFYLRRRPRDSFHARGLAIGLAVGCVAAVLQPLTGHVVGEAVAENQPIKLAALEAHWETSRAVPLTLLGWPDEADETTRLAIHVPYLLSVLATGDPNGEVQGLKAFPAGDRPPVAVTHLAYEVMLACAAVAATTAGSTAILVGWKRRLPSNRLWLTWVAATAPVGMLGIEAGWTATEVGRQPWVAHGILRTADAVTPMPHLVVPFTAFTLLYLFLGAVTFSLMRRQFHHAPVDLP